MRQHRAAWSTLRGEFESLRSRSVLGVPHRSAWTGPPRPVGPPGVRNAYRGAQSANSGGLDPERPVCDPGTKTSLLRDSRPSRGNYGVTLRPRTPATGRIRPKRTNSGAAGAFKSVSDRVTTRPEALSALVLCPIYDKSAETGRIRAAASWIRLLEELRRPTCAPNSGSNCPGRPRRVPITGLVTTLRLTPAVHLMRPRRHPDRATPGASDWTDRGLSAYRVEYAKQQRWAKPTRLSPRRSTQIRDSVPAPVARLGPLDPQPGRFPGNR